MSFLFEAVAIPLWFIVFVLASATPLWIKWYKIFHKKFIVTGILQKKIQDVKTTAEIKVDVLKKATENWNADSESPDFSENKVKKRKVAKKEIDPVKKQNIRMVLKVLAKGGETGVLPKSIADKTDISSVETKGALTYLIEKKYAEVINSTNGEKYYLTETGTLYCKNKRYI